MDEKRELFTAFGIIYVFYVALAVISAAPFLWADKAPVLVIVCFAAGTVCLAAVPAVVTLVLALALRGICETVWSLRRARKAQKRLEKQIGEEVNRFVESDREDRTSGDARTHRRRVLRACGCRPEGGQDHPEGESES